ncbi:MAG TPA: hypothetical protein VD794_15380 [Flavisolibacter sp.]|nr:hypothetical protein [Flavisolibacter sp.]
MKKRLLALSMVMVLFTSIKSEAQLQRGNILVGGDIADFDLGLDEGGNFGLTINPKIAWFFRDNTALGGYLTFGLRTAKNAGTSINYGVGALARHYLGTGTTNLVQSSRFFIEANVGIEGDNPAVGDNTNGLGLGVGPGWSYFITPSVALEAMFKYNGIVGFGSAVTSNNLNLSVGFQVFLPLSRARAIKEDIDK